MRQSAARLNRAWLTILGVMLILTGLVGVIISTGLLTPLTQSAGLRIDRPRPDQALFGTATRDAFSLTWVVLITAAAGIIVALLGLGWLIAQVPRTNSAKPFRLHDDPKTGLTRIQADVLADAIEAQTKALSGVTEAAAVLRGSAARPDLTVRVTANDRADLPRLLERLHDQVATDLGDALDTSLRRLGVQLEITTTKPSTDRITVRNAEALGPSTAPAAQSK
jgi:hypothetical protein